MKARPPRDRAQAIASHDTTFADWILWQDAELVAVNKPAGVASQGGDGLAGRNLVDLARAHWPTANIAVLHRLDRNVSGIVLLAKTTRAARAMSELVASGAIERRYEAVVKGTLTTPMLLSHWLRKDTRNNQVHLIDAPDDVSDSITQRAPADHKHTQTRVAPIAELSSLLGMCTVLSAWPITGRSHQIRAQLSAAGFPIVGDPKYGVEALGLRRPLLHATQVRFPHPSSGQEITIDAPVPWSRSFVAKLRKPKR